MVLRVLFFYGMMMKKILFPLLSCFVLLCGCSENPAREGKYLSEYDSSDLVITKAENGYQADMGIFRLTTFDAMKGELSGENLILISDSDDDAKVTFLAEKQENGKYTVKVIDSQWKLLENGTVFEFTKQEE